VIDHERCERQNLIAHYNALLLLVA